MTSIADFVGTDAFNSRYETSELLFHDAVCAHFTCKYAYRDDATVYHFYPTLPELAQDIVQHVGAVLEDSVTLDVRTRTRVDLMDDPDIGGVSVCVIIPDFTASTQSSSEMLARRLITRLHDALSQ